MIWALELSSGVSVQVKVARSFWSKARGLLFAKKIQDNQCLIIPGCRSVHTMCMAYHLDIVFIDALGRVTDVYPDVPPFRIRVGGHDAVSVVEFASGALSLDPIIKGQPLFKQIQSVCF